MKNTSESTSFSVACFLPVRSSGRPIFFWCQEGESIVGPEPAAARDHSQRPNRTSKHRAAAIWDPESVCLLSFGRFSLKELNGDDTSLLEFS